uniref:Major facilitator Superfamily putative n=1 Tax=Albugo laibachii Nc14 TaxID=890382 RepID=F0WQ86_9STRA|nr:Major facilitator Superfamily putative [Albugo laibachii Nc14]|eukprot:CCA23492.1 Major facilitator Superfamily putative [Albugo laibachii Nc14]
MEKNDSEYGTFETNAMRDDLHEDKIQGSGKKWLMLTILSLLSGTNQAICYSYAPIVTLSERRWGQQLHSTELITIYFIAYIPCSFLGSWIIDRMGLRYGVLLGAMLQALGASFRYLGTHYGLWNEVYLTILGQVLAAVAMPFMVNSPPVLSANWFPTSLRATATSIAVNANAMGIAVVYLAAPFFVHTIEDIPSWEAVIAVFAIALWILTYFAFMSFPESPWPTRFGLKRNSLNVFETASTLSDVHLQDEYNWKQWGNAFAHSGFWITVLVFSVAECVLNAMSALLAKFLSTEGFTKPQVDRRQNHVQALQVCIVASALSLALFKFTLGATNGLLTLTTLLLLGAALGPLQPIVLELGVECSFPTSESTVAALQQLCGNFLSAILVPAFSILRRKHADDTGRVPQEYIYATPEWIMVFLLLITSAAFCFFNGEYKRANYEQLRLSSSKPSIPTVVGSKA